MIKEVLFSEARVLYYCADFNNFNTPLATAPPDAGFCPVTTRSSTTANAAQSSPFT